MAASPGWMGWMGRTDWMGAGWVQPVLPCLPASPAYPARPALLNLHRFSDDLLQRPALAAAERTRFDDFDRVTDLGRVLLVVDHELRRPALGLAVEPVTDLPFDGDDAAFLHPVADDHADFLRFA